MLGGEDWILDDNILLEDSLEVSVLLGSGGGGHKICNIQNLDTFIKRPNISSLSPLIVFT